MFAFCKGHCMTFCKFGRYSYFFCFHAIYHFFCHGKRIDLHSIRQCTFSVFILCHFYFRKRVSGYIRYFNAFCKYTFFRPYIDTDRTSGCIGFPVYSRGTGKLQFCFLSIIFQNCRKFLFFILCYYLQCCISERHRECA